MFLLNYTDPDNAAGPIKEIYSLFPQQMGPPPPLQLMSSSPEFLACQFKIMTYFSNHKALGFSLLTAIRYLAANVFGHESCLEFNRRILTASGATPRDIEAIISDPDRAPLDAREKALLKFVAKVLQTPGAVNENDVQELRGLGWKDSHILDAAAHGTFMCGHAALMKAFILKSGPA